MKIFKKQTKRVKILKDIKCDCCGKSCKSGYGYEYMKLEANWGFGSRKDFEHWTAYVCEKCVDKKLVFINFERKNLMINSDQASNEFHENN